MRQTPHALRVHVANADRVQRGDAAGASRLQETFCHSNDQRFRHGMAAARPADQDRVAVMYQICGLVK